VCALLAKSAPSLGGRARVPPNLNKDKLKEIMVFNAVQLEKEVAPLRKQIAEAKRANPSAQVNPEILADLQQRISDAVRARFGYTDDQVMAAVDKFGAKEDPQFRDVLARITNTLASLSATVV
jgi:hypothetical protein